MFWCFIIAVKIKLSQNMYLKIYFYENHLLAYFLEKKHALFFFIKYLRKNKIKLLSMFYQKAYP